MNKLEVFCKELNYIKNENYRKSAEKLIELLPDYFFKIPASSTGKYHPSYALGSGGLVRHTKVAVRIAYELLYNNNTIGSDFNDDEKDLIIIALILHDGLKSGYNQNQYTQFDHPLLISTFINNYKEEILFCEEEINLLTAMIESHMGEWTSSPHCDIELPKPITKYQKFVHMCDYLASKKFLNVNFENNEFID